jgi:hypothetical protein
MSGRRTISLICALALTCTGVFLFFYLLLYAPTPRWPLLIGGALAGFFGLYWLTPIQGRSDKTYGHL